MTNSLSMFLSQPQRALFTAAVLGLMFFPTLWICVSAFGTSWTEIALHVSNPPFQAAVLRSLTLASATSALSLAVAWPWGVTCGLWRFPGRRFALVICSLPLLLPTFLWAIGFSSLRAFLPYRWQFFLDGLPGSILATSTLVIPLVLFATILAGRCISSSQREAAILAGGHRALFAQALRFTFPAATCAAVLGSTHALSDTGPSQIMGYHGASSEILIAFAARYDLQTAAHKAMAFALLMLPWVAIAAWVLASHIHRNLLARERGGSMIVLPSLLKFIPASGLVILVTVVIATPVLGLVWPLLSPPATPSLWKAVNAARETAFTTLFYGLTATGVASFLGIVLASLAGRSRTPRFVLIFLCLLFLVLSPSLHSLGLVMATSSAPAFLDPILRSGWIVGFGSGLRFTPVAALICLIAASSSASSWSAIAALHAVPRVRYAWHVWIPWIAPSILVSIVAVFLLSAADVSNVMLLQPPGSVTFPGRLFTVMDNASARYIAALCTVYLGAGLACLALLALILKGRRS